MDIKTSPFLSDVLLQVPALRQAISRFDPRPLEPLAASLNQGGYDRIILTGMGASYYASYPAWSYLAGGSTPVMWLDAAELLHYALDQITPRTLIWIVSQSGRSAEIMALLERLRHVRPVGLLVTTNDLSSPLAQNLPPAPTRSVLMPIDAEPETTVSTRTYLNSLALCQLGARVLYGADLSLSFASLETAMQGMQGYLDDWQVHFQVIGENISQPSHLVLTGRGASLASVYCGALIIGEAGSSPAIGMPAGQFRHGPLEMCSPDLSVIVLAGPEKTRHLNQRLAIDIAKCGANSFWLGPEIEGVTSLPMPLVDDLALPLAEMLPLQLLTIYLAEQAGRVPGVFKFIGKVTLEE